MTRQKDIVVAGSHVYGAYIGCADLPQPGETVAGQGFDGCVLDDGGKGSNQAFCAARLGASTTFLGVVGSDPQGAAAMDVLQRQGCDVSYVERHTSIPTGVSVAIVDRRGLSMIVTDPGANQALDPVLIDKHRDVIAAHRWCLLQFETPLQTVLHTSRVTRELGVRTLLTPGPMLALRPGDLANIDVLIPNETEAADLLAVRSLDGSPVDVARSIAKKWHVPNVVLTRGASGVAAWWDGRGYEIPAFKVEARNTIGAGDGFSAALATALSRNAGIAEALSFASAVAALAVSHAGAPWSSYPEPAVVRDFLQERRLSSLAHKIL
ncbi:MAG: ribokinase [Rhizobiaceae bacterium]|nr:ribokinase [Rhizobiaceae bacterium]